MSTPSAPGRTTAIGRLRALRRPSRPRPLATDRRRRTGSAVLLLVTAALVATAWIGLPSQRFDLELSAGRAPTSRSTTQHEPSTTTQEASDRPAGGGPAQGGEPADTGGPQGDGAAPARTVSVSGHVPAAGTTAAGLLLCLLVVRRRRRRRLIAPEPEKPPAVTDPPAAADGGAQLEPASPTTSAQDGSDDLAAADLEPEETADTSDVATRVDDAPSPPPRSTEADGGLRTREASTQVTVLERRSARRVDVEMAADAHWSSRQSSVVVVNLSLTGAACTLPPGSTPGTPTTPQVGDHVDLRLPLLGRAVDVAAKVQWVRTVDSRPQMGLLFVDVPAPARQQLRQFMRSTETR